MLTNLRLTARRAALGLTTVLVAVAAPALVAATPTPAEPAPRCGTGGCDDDGSDAESGNGTVSITVWGSGTTAGDEGYEIPAETVYVMPPCFYWASSLTGKEYYDQVESGYYDNMPTPDREPYEPWPNYEQYKDDTEGEWWLTACSSENYEGSLDDFQQYATDWFAEHHPVYVELNEQPPVPDIPPELLMEVAYDEMTLPEPEIAWNPRRDGDGATIVNVPTWLWLDDGPVTLEVNAQAGDNVARVVAVLGSMNFSAANAAPVSCTGTGVPWSEGATTDCSLTFTRSSANQPGQVSRVLAESQWDIEWFANGEPQGPLDPQTTSATFDVPVAEVQAVVTD
ncbi:hypothetical protein [Jiangella asiatica]|uniref:Secreted protein n=1 Tax=Jiangella asiatica TaxID=2530372 RepID=A0A4R5DAS3_9ACTN|nr:hypothetical protein [Jiangella asiatica]TDE08891.1 hypothetical protein E1269_15805 [Jiangella asiatica]